MESILLCVAILAVAVHSTINAIMIHRLERELISD